MPGHVTTRAELNEWEASNILQAEKWAFSRSWGNSLTIDFMKRLHTKMFDKTWKWAGEFRRSEKNIGVPWIRIAEASRDLFDDVEYWLENETYPLEEIAARLHHRLTVIHPFPNGNGRLARMLTDVFLVSRGHKRFAWGLGNLAQEGEARARYLAALRAADGGEMQPLLDFLSA